MRSSIGSVKLGSLAPWPAILTLAMSFGFSSGLTGCVIDDYDHQVPPESATPDRPPADTPAPSETPLEVTIDADQALEADAGDGVGVFVEYTKGGHWRVWTSCDTNLSEAVCTFDAFVSVAAGDKITNAVVEGLEKRDVMEKLSDGSLHLSVQTSAEFDAMTFDTAPGAVVELKVLFDNDLDPRVIYWLGDGVVHQGAPTNPIDFKPSDL